MNNTLIRGGFFVLLMAGLGVATPAHAVPVTFQVRMAEQIVLGTFDPAVDFVDVAGTFNGWGGSPLIPLTDADGDSIYEVTVNGFTAGEIIEFKYRINGLWDGTEEFPGAGNNRVYTVQASNNVILVWYNDFPPPSGATGPVYWWNDTVFYEAFVRSFKDSDGDGVGDLQGLTQKLDYLNDGDPATTNDLGVTGIWLMPINDSPSYHGYDAVDYRTVNPDYGTGADFQAFLAAAHARGIKVIIDLVMNHCSNQHPWFTAAAGNDPAFRNFFRWSPTNPGETGPWGQNVWHQDSSGWYYGLFGSGMPDLNYDTPAVKDSMFTVATYWLDTVGVDGFRLDAVLYIDEDPGQLQTTPGTLQFWQDYRTHVKAVKPDAFSVGEAWTATNEVVQYVTGNRLDICFEFDLAYTMLAAVNTASAGGLGSKAIQVYGTYPYLQFGTFLSNHDQDRSFTVLGQDQGKAKVAAGIYLTLPGVPFVYYGEEIGMIGSGDHRNIRSPMQWTAGSGAGFTTGTPWQTINNNYPQFNVAVEEQDSGSLLEWYKQLIHLRNATPALRRGTHEFLASSAAPVLAFVRSDSVQTLLCLANTSGSPQSGFTVTGGAGSLVPGDHPAVNLLDPLDTLQLSVSPAFAIAGLNLSGYEVAVYELARTTAVDPGGDPLPDLGLRLANSRPNPFQRSTTIRYTLPARSYVRLVVYDLAGRKVKVLQDGVQAKGARETHWDGTGATGRPLGKGMYFLRLDAGEATRFSKIVLLR